MRILIGYDGSEHSDFAIEDLSKAGLPDSTEALVLTVSEAGDLPTIVTDRVSSGASNFVHPTTRMIQSHLEDSREKGLELARSAAARLREMFPKWDVSEDAICGTAAKELVIRADQWQPDLLVVGSTGRSTLTRLVLGSVSRKVLHEASCSVRISRRNEADETAAPRTLVAVDGSPGSEDAVKTVSQRRWGSEAQIRLIAVDDPFSQPAAAYMSWNFDTDRPVENEHSREWLAKMFEGPEELLRSTGSEVSHNVRWGDAALGILQEAKDWQADTIFVGARGMGRMKRFLLGSVSSAVAAKAHCSVEVVREQSK